MKVLNQTHLYIVEHLSYIDVSIAMSIPISVSNPEIEIAHGYRSDDYVSYFAPNIVGRQHVYTY